MTRPESAEPMDRQYWLMKIEPDECSIDDLAALGAAGVPWTGVRNYQARNFMRDAMRCGDGVLYYHSSCPEPGVAGLAEVCSGPEPDATQFDPASAYFDAKSTPAAPRWVCVRVRHVRTTRLLSLAELRQAPELADLQLLKPGSRLSITPVTPLQWQRVLARLGVTTP